MDSLKTEMNNKKISADFNLVDQAKAFTIRLAKPDDARNAYNLINFYKARLTQVPLEAELATGKPVRVALEPQSLTQSIEQDVEGARKGISDRVDQLGVTQPRISIQGKDRIRVQVPGEKDPDKLIDLVIKPANLEFHLVSQRMNEVIGPDGKVKPGAPIPPGTEVVPFKSGKLDPTTNEMAYTESQILINKKAELTGKNLRSAGVNYNPSSIDNPIEVTLEFDREGTKRFAEVTEQNVGRQLAILLDGVVRSAPRLNEAIREGRAQITGGFTNEEASDLSQILKAGSLKAPLVIESKRTVGASLGAESIQDGVRALRWGSIVIAIVMILYYGTAGVIAVIALIVNILIVLAMMGLSHATLTLSGIGGILLTIGMAVDANILIYERIREEFAAGRPMRQAISLGFGRALNVIMDSHISPPCSQRWSCSSLPKARSSASR